MARHRKADMTIPVWLKDTAERAFWTFAASFVGAAGYQAGAHLEDIHWVAALDIATVATIFSALKSGIVAHVPVGEPGTASAVKL